MGSNRIKSNKLALEFDGVDYWADATKVELDNEDADSSGATTFEDAALGGGRQFFFTVGAVQSTALTSFWTYLWENTGEEVPFTYAPHGNAAPSESQPHFTGTVKIGPKPKLGGEASANGDFTFETRLDVIGTPLKVGA